MKKTIIIFLTLILITGCGKKDKDELKAIYKKEISNLLEKSYNISLFSYGKLLLDDEKILLEEKEFYLVKNGFAKNLKELNELLNEVYPIEKHENFYEQLYGNKKFVEVNKKLYVHEEKESCDIGENYDFNDFEITQITDEYIEIFLDNFYYQIFKKDDKLYFVDDVYKCLDIKNNMLKIPENEN